MGQGINGVAWTGVRSTLGLCIPDAVVICSVRCMHHFLKKLWLLLFCSWLVCYQLQGQTPFLPPANHWWAAGFQLKMPDSYKVIPFAGQPGTGNDNAPALQAILDTITQPTIVLMGSGDFYFQRTIYLRSNTVLKGLGNDRTRLFVTPADIYTPCISIEGSEPEVEYPISGAVTAGDSLITITTAGWNAVAKGDYIRLVQNDSSLVNDGWALRRTGQVVRIDALLPATQQLRLSAPVRIPYPATKNPVFRKLNPVAFSGVECLRVERMNTSPLNGGTANIEFGYAHHCWVRGVESVKCNFSHIEASFSAHLYIHDNYFQDAFDFGDGGLGYGVTLHQGTSDCRVENNVFRRLRHAMLMQIGANGNVFAYNYAYQSRKEGAFGIVTTGEDMVVHGNYSYHNLFEENYAQYASVDNSHGTNGPYNTYFRNIVTSQGFDITNSQSNYQQLLANHRLGGTNDIRGSQHVILYNSWQGASTYNVASLAYPQRPAFVPAGQWGQIGPPLFNASASIPARDRATANQPITLPCRELVWDGTAWRDGFAPGPYTGAFTLRIEAGQPANVSGVIAVDSLLQLPGSTLRLAPGSAMQVGTGRQ